MVFGWTGGDTPDEVYMWDGATTFNMSENEAAWDGAVQWSSDGQLMFLSGQGESYGHRLWDGVTYQDGAPVIKDLVLPYAYLDNARVAWTPDNLIAIGAHTDVDSQEKAMALWDVARETVVREIPITSDRFYSYLTPDGRLIYSTHLASGLPSVFLDIETLDGEMLFSDSVGSFAWSDDGYLLYCGMNGSGVERLTIWDGTESWLVDTVSYRPAIWQSNGDGVNCNNG